MTLSITVSSKCFSWKDGKGVSDLTILGQGISDDLVLGEFPDMISVVSAKTGAALMFRTDLDDMIANEFYDGECRTYHTSNGTRLSVRL